MKSNRRVFLRRTGTAAFGAAAGLSFLRCAPNAEPVAPTDFSAYDGVGLAELVRNGDVAPAELVEDVARKIDQVNPQLNAVLTELFDIQLAIDRASGPLGDGPLSGVPVLLKNLTGWAGANIDSGSRLISRAYEAGTAPTPNSTPLVAAMENSGMVISGLTNSPEFGMIDSTEPILWGATRNPWNLDYTPGGSSGGTGSAVAAGITPLGHGNDGGGSIRLPASQCGLFGLKPSRGRELGNNPDNPLGISSDLCLSQTVRDTAAFLSVVENTDLGGLPRAGHVTEANAKRLRIAVLADGLQGKDPHPEVMEGLHQTAQLCGELGHEMAQVSLPFDGDEFIDAFIGFWATEALGFEQLVPALLGADVPLEEVLEPWTLGLLAMAKERGGETSGERARDVFARTSASMATLFESHDVVLSPVLREPPYRIGHHDPSVEFNELLDRVLDVVAYTPLQNAVGMPGMSVPLHWTADGLPVGMQFSAAVGQDQMLLELAYELEEARPWRDRKPPVFAAGA